MNGRRNLFVLLFGLCLAPALVLAQADCPTIVNNALAAIDEVCSPTGRNQACYGNILLEAQPRAGITDFHFTQPGDLTNVADLTRLRLSAFDGDQSTWGVALMKIQANIPDTLPGQNVTFLLFGDVEIWDAQGTLAKVNVQATNTVIVYDQPSVDSRMEGRYIVNQVLTADGRLEDTSWLRIIRPDNPETSGWIETSRLQDNPDIQRLPVLNAPDSETQVVSAKEPQFGPMQAFYFRSGLQSSPCAEVPASGILIQAPSESGPVKLRVNDVDLLLGSTAYLTALPGDSMSIDVLEGGALVGAGDAQRSVPAGTQVKIPIDANSVPTGSPAETQPYVQTALQNLPMTPLERDITIAPALTPEQIQSLGVPIAGQWHQVGFVTFDCPNKPSQSAVEEDQISVSQVTAAGFVVMNLDSPTAVQNAVTLNRNTPNGFTYSGDWEKRLEWLTAHYDYRVISPASIFGHVEAVNQNGCVEHIDRELRLQTAA